MSNEFHATGFSQLHEKVTITFLTQQVNSPHKRNLLIQVDQGDSGGRQNPIVKNMAGWLTGWMEVIVSHHFSLELSM